MVFKTVSVISNISKPKVASQTPKIVKFLQQKALTVKLAEDVIGQLKCDGLACTNEQIVDCDLIITVGGDGTVLKAVNLLQGKSVPILAVNYGKLGFLQEVEPQNFEQDLELLLQGKFHIEERALLEANFESKKHLILNDLVLSHDGFRIMELKTYVNDTFFYEYAADGLAIATATGASAYSFSAGGPFVDPKANVNVMTPINPHTLLNRAIVLASEDFVKVEVASINGNLKISTDGLLAYHGRPLIVEIKSAKQKVSLIKLRESNYFAFLRKKLRILCGVNGVD